MKKIIIDYNDDNKKNRRDKIIIMIIIVIIIILSLITSCSCGAKFWGRIGDLFSNFGEFFINLPQNSCKIITYVLIYYERGLIT